jgi:hypothetical protein
VLGTEYLDTLTNITNLALTYRNQGRWKKAEELKVQVIETRKRVLGTEHPDTLINMNNLTHTLKHQNHDDEAIELMASCIKLCIKILGPSHHHTESVFMTLITWLSANCVTRQKKEQSTSCMPGA